MVLPSTYMQHIYTGVEPSQAFDVVYGTSFEHRLTSVKLSTMKHQRLTIGNIRLETGWYDFPVIAQGSMPRNAVCIGFMAQGGDTTRFNMTEIRTDEIQIYPAGAGLLYHATGSSRWVNFIVSEDTLQETAMSRNGQPLNISRLSPYSIQLPPGGRSALTTLADDAFGLGQHLHATGGMSPDVAAEVHDALLTAYVDALSTAQSTRKTMPSSTKQRHYHLISACEQLVLTGADANIALSEIATRSGYSLRALELIFRRGVGMTPGRWFMTARLNGALRDFLTCDESSTVSNIAMNWGFRHMSRFAEYYRRAFGESPSTTLRRPRPHT